MSAPDIFLSNNKTDKAGYDSAKIHDSDTDLANLNKPIDFDIRLRRASVAHKNINLEIREEQRNPNQQLLLNPINHSSEEEK